ncbi:MAG: septum formation initiator family protein [Bacteroidetes bacterium]|nr:septum formation initiator family protein [Bacteroidota bacterium]MBL0139869.1 septum formation initiator family protein [Bacteroidota bacterium]
MEDLFPYLRNKYTLTFLGFLIWLSFFDRNDFITTSSYRQKLNELKTQKEYFEEEIEKNKAYLLDLQTNRENLEKYGREKYFMKRDNEDVFVIVDKRKKK